MVFTNRCFTALFFTVILALVLCGITLACSVLPDEPGPGDPLEAIPLASFDQVEWGEIQFCIGDTIYLKAFKNDGETDASELDRDTLGSANVYDDVTYTWVFDDGTTTKGTMCSFMPQEARTYHITLYVTDFGSPYNDTDLVRTIDLSVQDCSSPVIHVRLDGNDANDGYSWATAKASITAAIADAESGEEIWVGAGTYVENITLKSGVSLFGRFHGTETSKYQRDWKYPDTVTIIQAKEEGYIVRVPESITGSTIFNGFRVQGSSGDSGSGILCENSSPTISNNVIISNTSTGNGAGIHCVNSSANINNNLILGNSTPGYGGGLYCEGGSPQIVNNTFHGNYAAHGCGIYLDSSSALIANNIVVSDRNYHLLYNNGSGSPTLYANYVYGYNDVGGPLYYGFGSSGIIEADPKLTANGKFGDMHLRSGSPCVNTGNNSSVVTGSLDMDGEIRIWNDTVDIGADEYGSCKQQTFLQITPSSGFVARGSFGGPFSNYKRCYTLTNLGSESLDWTAEVSGSVDWLSISSEGGTLSPTSEDGQSSSTRVIVWVNDEANSLTSGTYTGEVVFSNTTDSGSGDTTLIFTLEIDSRDVGSLEVTPADGLFIIKYSDETYNQTSKTYTVHNTGTTPIDWAVETLKPWLSSPSNDSFTLAAGNSTYITLELDTEASIKSGDSNLVTFNNVTQGSSTCRAVQYVEESSSSFSVNPTSTYYASGVTGGPFTPSEEEYLLTNGTSADATWTATASQNWISLSCGTSGVLPRGYSIPAKIWIGPGANSLSAGSYTGTVTFSSGLTNVTIAVHLTVTGSGPLNISPSDTTLDFTGPAGGDFVCKQYNSESAVFTLTNGGGTALDWSITDLPDWLDATATSGTLDGNNPSDDVALSIDETATVNYEVGTIRQADIKINNDDSGWTKTLTVYLTIESDEEDGFYKIIRVSDNGSESNDGSNWNNATTLNNALNILSKSLGGEIWAKTGAYYGTISIPIYVYVYGGFAGEDDSEDTSTRNWLINPTTIDGNAGESVAKFISVSSYSAIDGFTIRNGRGTTSGSDRCGGGIYCYQSSPTIAHNIVTGNLLSGSVTCRGGGIYSIGGSPTIVNNAIIQNTVSGAPGIGAGIYCEQGVPIIRNNTVAGNILATSSTTLYGSGLHFTNCAANVVNNIIASNTGAVGIAGDGTQSATFEHNDVYGHLPAEYYGNVSSSLQNAANDNIFSQPNLRNDLIHIPLTSYCRQAGDSTGVSDTELDLDCKSRKDGTYIDIGATQATDSLPYILKLSASQSCAAVGENIAITATVTNPYDYGLPVENCEVHFEITGSGKLLDGTTEVTSLYVNTNSDGQAVASVKGISSGTATVTATLTSSITVIKSLNLEFATGDDWPMFQHDAQRTGRCSNLSRMPTTIEKVWSAESPSPSSKNTSPVIFNGKVITATSKYYPAYPDTIGDVRAFDALTGEPWKTWQDVPYSGGATMKGIYGTPCIDAASGKIVIGSSDGYVYCFDLYGDSTKLWAMPTYTQDAVPQMSSISTSPVIHNGVVYVCNEARKIYGFQISDGQKVLDISLPSFLENTHYYPSTPAIASFDGKDYLLTVTNPKYTKPAYSWYERPPLAGTLIRVKLSDGSLAFLKWCNATAAPAVSGNVAYVGRISYQDGILIPDMKTMLKVDIDSMAAMGGYYSNTLSSEYNDYKSVLSINNYHEYDSMPITVFNRMCTSSPAISDIRAYYAFSRYYFNQSDIYNDGPTFGIANTNLNYYDSNFSTPALASSECDTSNADEYIVVGSSSNKLYVYNTKTGKKISTDDGGSSAVALSYNVDSEKNAWAYILSSEGVLKAYRLTGYSAVSTPDLSPSDNFTISTSQLSVTITCATSGATIRYTTDGSDPTSTSSSIASGGSISISSSTTVKAKAYKSGYTDSGIAAASYKFMPNAPTFDPDGSSVYLPGETVAIDCNTPYTDIYYTLDSTEPTTGSTKYATPIPLSTSTTLKARAYRTGWLPSAVTTVHYTICENKVAKPEITYNSTPPRSASITCATSGATIHYTTDGKEPTEASPTYSGSFSVDHTMTIKAIACKTDWIDSEVAALECVVPDTIPTPVFYPETGTYHSAQDVWITCDDGDAEIRYTDNGDEPDEYSTLYDPEQPIRVERTDTPPYTILKAKAFKDSSSSDTATATYTITGKVETPTFDPIPDTYSTSQCVHISCSTSGIQEIRYTLDGTVPTSASLLYDDQTGVTISQNTTIKAIALKTDWDTSNIAVGQYYITGSKVATPQFTLPSGTYSSPLNNVEITCATSGATIRYTTDGSIPTESSNLYDPLDKPDFTQIDESTPLIVTLKAKAFLTGKLDSDVATCKYTVTNRQIIWPADGAFTPKETTSSTPINVTIKCIPEDATIHYTTTGLDPDETSPTYIGSITVNHDTTIKAKAYKFGYLDSDVASITYTIQPKVAKPVFDPNGGTTTTISISCATEYATIYYTTDLSDPTESSNEYTGTFSISGLTKIKAQAFKDGMLASDIAYQVFNNNANPPGDASMDYNFIVPGWAEDTIPFDSVNSSDSDGHGPSSADSVCLASGAYVNEPGPDIAVYNPFGPSVSYSRSYRSTRVYDTSMWAPWLSPGWVDSLCYKITTSSSSNNLTLHYPDGATENMIPVMDQISTGSVVLNPSTGAPYFGLGVPVMDGEDWLTGQWSEITLKFSDESYWRFVPCTDDPLTYRISRFGDLCGYPVLLKYSGQTEYETSTVNQPAVTNMKCNDQQLLTFTYSDGKLSNITDNISERAISYTQDAQSRLYTVSQTSPSSILLWQYTYASDTSFLTRVDVPDPSGQASTSYNQIAYITGQPWRVDYLQDANGNIHQYEYNYLDRRSVTVSGSGSPNQTWTQKFDDNGTNTGSIDSLDHEDYTDYLDYLPITFTNKNDQITQVLYDYYGNVKQVTGPDDYVTKYTYEELTGQEERNQKRFQLLRIDSGRSGKWKIPIQFEYDSTSGRLTKVKAPKPGVSWSETNSSEPPATMPTGYQLDTQFTYTSLGNIDTIIEPGMGDGRVTITKYLYDTPEKSGQPTTVTVYDNTISSNTIITQSSYEYDIQGRVIRYTDALNRTTTIEYVDDKNSVYIYHPSTYTGTSDANHDSISGYGFAYAGGPLYWTAEWDATTKKCVRYQYYASGKESEPVKVWDSISELGSSVLDNLYRPRYIRDAKGNGSEMQYDAVGNLEAMIRPTGRGGMGWSFDKCGNVVASANGNNETIEYIRDPDDSRVVGKVSSDGKAEYTYDAFGRISTARDSESEITYTYDDNDNITSVTTKYYHSSKVVQSTINYEYNPDGSRKTMYVYPGAGSITPWVFNYTADSKEGWSGLVTSAYFPWHTSSKKCYYDRAGQLIKETYNGNVQTRYSYDAAGRMSGLYNWSLYPTDEYGYSSCQCSAFRNMIYDSVGNLTGMYVSMNDANNSNDYAYECYVQYKYDDRDRLTDEIRRDSQYTGSPVQYQNHFDYDEADNVTDVENSWSDGSYDDLSYPYDANNWVSNSSQFDYDDSGNIIYAHPDSDRTYSLTYNAEDQPTSITGGYKNLSMGYRVDGLRAWKQTSDALTFFFYDGDNLLYELSIDSSSTNAKVYGYNSEGLIECGETTPGQSSWYASKYYQFDPMGSKITMSSWSNTYVAYNYRAMYDSTGLVLFSEDTRGEESVAADAVGYLGKWGVYSDQETCTAAPGSAASSSVSVRNSFTKKTAAKMRACWKTICRGLGFVDNKVDKAAGAWQKSDIALTKRLVSGTTFNPDSPIVRMRNANSELCDIDEIAERQNCLATGARKGVGIAKDIDRDVRKQVIYAAATEVGGRVLGAASKGIAKGIKKGKITKSAKSVSLPKNEWEAGFVSEFRTTKTETYYRVYSGKNSTGGFLTKVKPTSRTKAIQGLSLRANNSAMYVQEVEVPAGTLLRRSRCAKMSGEGWMPGARGGLEQFELKGRIPDSCFKKGVRLPW